MNKIPFLFIVILVCISITLNAQQQENLTFEIIHNNKPIVELKAVKGIKYLYRQHLYCGPHFYEN